MLVHDRGEPAKRAVARQVALPVVDALEIVQVQKQEREGTVAAVGAADFGIEPVHEFTVIGKPSQSIVACLIDRLLFGVLAVRNVYGGAEAADDFTGCRAQWANADFQNAALPRVLKLRSDAAQGFAMLGNRRGVQVRRFEEFAKALSGERAWANCCRRQSAAPLRADSQIPVGDPEQARRLLHQQTQGGFPGRPDGFLGVVE